MAICSGKRKQKAGTCSSILYKCKKCANVGCMQSLGHECSNQGFSAVAKCLKCGAVSQKEQFK